MDQSLLNDKQKFNTFKTQIMKSLISFLFLFIFAIHVCAQNGISYQAKLSNIHGQVVANQEAVFELSILQGSANGDEVYSEFHAIQTNRFGLANMSIGNGTGNITEFENISWGEDLFYLNVKVKLADEDQQDLGTSMFGTVPTAIAASYAVTSRYADEAGFADHSETADSASVAHHAVEAQHAINADQAINATYAEHANKADTALDDMDRDSHNEIQEMTITDDILYLDNGGGNVSLEGFTSLWDTISGGINYSDSLGFVGIKQDNPTHQLHIAGGDNLLRLQGTGSLGQFGRMNFGDGDYVYLEEDSDDDFKIHARRLWLDSRVGIGLNNPSSQLHIKGGNSLLRLEGTGGAGQYGRLNFGTGEGAYLEEYSDNRLKIESSRLWLNSQVGINISTPSTTLEVNGSFSISNNGPDKIYGSAGISAYMSLSGSNNADNIIMSSLLSGGTSYYNNGALGVYGPQGTEGDTPPVLLFVDANGRGTLTLNGVKNFRIPHPEKEDKEIWYGCIEGPEAAAYERGTYQLTNGEAFIPFSEHFSVVGNHNTMTVILTPLDANSKGLAVVEKLSNGFRVKEMNNGNGNYEFDWEVKAVRKGFENFKVIREKNSVGVSKIDKENTK